MSSKKNNPLNIDLGKLPEVDLKENKAKTRPKSQTPKIKKENPKEDRKPGPTNKVPSNWKKTSIKADPKVLERLKIYIIQTDKYETRDQLLNELIIKFLDKNEK